MAAPGVRRDKAALFPVGESPTRQSAPAGITGAVHEATSRLFESGYSIVEVQQFTLHDSWGHSQQIHTFATRDNQDPEIIERAR